MMLGPTEGALGSVVWVRPLHMAGAFLGILGCSCHRGFLLPRMLFLCHQPSCFVKVFVCDWRASYG
jgi:hypothetical protein